jgi:hypothetical protein
MKRAVPIALLFMICSLLVLPAASLADTKAVLQLPDLGANGMADDLYLYSCANASCSSPTQLADYGHITNVPRWPKGNGGPGGAPPAIWVFVTIPDSGFKYFQLWQNNGTCWQSCILGINAQGDVDNSSTTCLGVAPPTQNKGLSAYSFGTATFDKAACATPPANRSETNTTPARSLTFVNNTSARTVCLQTDSSFEHPECTGAGANKVTSQSPYIIASSDLVNGSNSGVGQVSGVQVKDGDEWLYTGRGTSVNAQVYATNLEWTVWPQHVHHTMGPTTIDISLVNGFNVGATLTPDQDCVCSVADTEGGVPYFVLYKAGVPMAEFPKPEATGLSLLCPQGSEAPISQDNKYGCYSSCSKARYYLSSDQDQLCCDGVYNTAATCTDPPSRPYVQNINKYSTRVYSWAFNDWRGTFTCEPTASFTFSVTDIDEIL